MVSHTQSPHMRVQAGGLLAHRYRVKTPIGRGGHGEVWIAHDLLLDQEVAVKIFREGAEDPLRFRREIAILRMLRLPGVAQLLNDGIEDGCPFLVTEYIHGHPFPGATLTYPCIWDALEGLILSILQTIAQVHASGVVHRDLKPENILIPQHGPPMIIDFGLSAKGPLYGDDNAAMGTLLYAAPEQLRGDPICPATDLYALAATLFEALTGRLPHLARRPRELIVQRLSIPPPPVGTLAENIPPRVAALIDSMLAVEVQDRPSCAEDVLRALRGGALRPRLGTSLPWLGDRAAIARVADQLQAGQPADIVGPAGIGRTRFAAEVADHLEAQGFRILRTQSSKRPFESLAPILGRLDDLPTASLPEVVAEVHKRLDTELAGTTLLVADDAEKLDKLSFETIEKRRERGNILRTYRESTPRLSPEAPAFTLPLQPLKEAELRALFLGFDRIFHFPSDAAALLWSRTQGYPGRIAAELERWSYAGMAHKSGERFMLDRENLHRLTISAPLSGPETKAVLSNNITPPFQTDLLQWLELAYPDTQSTTIAGAMGEPLWRIEAGLDELAQEGWIRRTAHGIAQPVYFFPLDTPRRNRDTCIGCSRRRLLTNRNEDCGTCWRRPMKRRWKTPCSSQRK